MFIISLRSFAVLALLAGNISSVWAQETDNRALPPSMQDGVLPPEHVIYGAFLRHAASFERRARDNESNGQSGEMFRSHLTQALGIDKQEQGQVNAIALEYFARWSALRERAIVAANNF